MLCNVQTHSFLVEWTVSYYDCRVTLIWPIIAESKLLFHPLFPHKKHLSLIETELFAVQGCVNRLWNARLWNAMPC
jgi:hypothetical protein